MLLKWLSKFPHLVCHPGLKEGPLAPSIKISWQGTVYNAASVTKCVSSYSRCCENLRLSWPLLLPDLRCHPSAQSVLLELQWAASGGWHNRETQLHLPLPNPGWQERTGKCCHSSSWSKPRKPHAKFSSLTQERPWPAWASYGGQASRNLERYREEIIWPKSQNQPGKTTVPVVWYPAPQHFRQYFRNRKIGSAWHWAESQRYQAAPSSGAETTAVMSETAVDSMADPLY